MSTYSIKDLENLSGIKAHTLRIWEQRYQLLSPRRTDTNIRYYDQGDLKRILNVALLNDHGLKISRIAAMDQAEICQEVLTLTQSSWTQSAQVTALTSSLIDLDEDRFEEILVDAVAKFGFERAMLEIIYPFMGRIGVLWQTGTISPAQEHFISNLVRQKLFVAIDGLPKVSGGSKFLLFLPEGELHEISLLFSSYLAKASGHRVIYLGQSTPMEDLQMVYGLHQPEYLVTVFTSYPPAEEVQIYLNTLSSQFPSTQILVSGYQVVGRNFSFPANVKLMNQIADFKNILK